MLINEANEEIRFSRIERAHRDDDGTVLYYVIDPRDSFKFRVDEHDEDRLRCMLPAIRSKKERVMLTAQGTLVWGGITLAVEDD